MKKNYDNKKMKDRKFKDYNEKPELCNIEDVDKKMSGKKVFIQGQIDRVIQTGGPTIFEVNDGTGNLSLKAFIVAGERAYPTIESGDFILALVSISEFNGELEGDIAKISKQRGEDARKIKEIIEDKLRAKAKVNFKSFLIESQILEKLKPRFINAAQEIRLAVFQNRPIIVRHHNDADGYSSGFALEKAIIPLIQRQHSNPKAAWEFFMRSPCSAPYYEIDDSIRDTATSLRNAAKFSNKMPLILIVDNGSTQQDLIAIKQAKIHGSDIIVVDHHPFEKDVISEQVLSHINPFLVGESGSKFSAGMLCSELARLINPEVENMEPIPAMAGLADRIDLENKEGVDKYCELAEKKGYSKKLLNEISLVIDYTSAKLRFLEAREYIEVLFGEPREQQRKLVDLMAPYIKNLDAKGLAMGKSNRIIEEYGDKTLQIINIEETFPGFGFFPKPGRSVGLVHDNLKQEKKNIKLVTVGVMNTAMTFRATDSANFSVHEMIKNINKKIPNSFVEGGGHKNAGSITFLPYKKKEILELVKEFIKSSK